MPKVGIKSQPVRLVAVIAGGMLLLSVDCGCGRGHPCGGAEHKQGRSFSKLLLDMKQPARDLHGKTRPPSHPPSLLACLVRASEAGHCCCEVLLNAGIGTRSDVLQATDRQ
jgi:hypothetical protein